MDYRYNNLNQLTEQSDDGWKTHTTSAYDNRGNLILETYHKGNKASVTGAYTYDETNKMVLGVNDLGEESIYTYNGLGALMENTWVIKKNAYGYHDVRASAVVDGEAVVDFATGKKEKKEKKTAEEVAASPALNKTSTVVKQFVVDFTSETYKPLMEHEVNGLDYRYVYSDKARLSVVVQGIENGSASVLDSSGELHAYYHCDYLGTTDYLTSAVNSKIISWTSYNEWGEITHNAVLKCGQRELDLVKEYATHDFDAVLNQYYAKARFYDADNRRFTAVDPIKDGLNWYTYCTNNPVMWLDPWGLVAIINGNTFGTRSLKDSVYGYESEYATFQDLVTAYGGYVSTGTDRSGISYLQGHIYNGQANGSIMLNYFLSGSNKGQLIARDGSHKVSFDTSKLAMRGETAYVNVAYFHKLMCDFGRQASFNIGTRNTGLTSAEINAATQAYGLSATQVAALKKINDYYYDNRMLANKDTTVFAFEGVSHSLNETINSKSPWYRYHPWGQFDAMFVSVRNGQIVALTKNASTLPDDPTRSGSYVMKEGLYSLLPFRHRGYAATEVRNFSGDDEVPTYLYGKDGGTVNGIDLHVSYSYDRSHKSNTMYWTTPSTWSQGCLTVNISDYIQFGAATGFLNGNSYDYYADYGLSNKENWDYTTFKANFKYETYGNKSFSGNLVVDRSALRNKISATGNKELLKYYFGE